MDSLNIKLMLMAKYFEVELGYRTYIEDFSRKHVNNLSTSLVRKLYDILMDDGRNHYE